LKLLANKDLLINIHHYAVRITSTRTARNEW
jgi:hypothetical protein